MWETVWTFNTPSFRVTLDVAPETMVSPEDQLEEQKDIDYANEGGWHWFQARVQVAYIDRDNPVNWAIERLRVVGEDYLGACSYESRGDFLKGGYFHDMVREAVREARGTIARMSSTKVRAPADH